jgi:hypothetical protein
MGDLGLSQVPPLGGVQSGGGGGTVGVSAGVIWSAANSVAILGGFAAVYRSHLTLEARIAQLETVVNNNSGNIANLARELNEVRIKNAIFEKAIRRIPVVRTDLFNALEFDRQEWQEGLRRSNENFTKLKGDKDVPLQDVANVPTQPPKQVRINGDRPTARRSDSRPRGRRPAVVEEDSYEEEEEDIEDLINDLNGSTRRSR